MCDYQGYEFGAGIYKDSICIGGFLFDADSWDGKGYTSPAQDEEQIPCPRCNAEFDDEITPPHELPGEYYR